MKSEYSHLHIARFVIEADTAFAIASGLSDGAFDALVVRDANNLPAIPGTSLAGVLRNLYQQAHGDQECDGLFGYIDPYEKQVGQPSRIQVSWGCVHDSKDKPVEGIRDSVANDILLERLAQDHPITRERVKLNTRGVAEDKKKFDKTLIPAGCRFSFEITLWAESDDETEWHRLHALLAGSGLRIGGSIRSGMGKFSLKRLHHQHFDLKDRAQFIAFSMLQAELDSIEGLKVPCEVTNETSGLSLDIVLHPEDYWRVGQGTQSLQDSQKGDIEPQALPVTEPCIEWGGSIASILPRKVVVPGSGVKGAIRHRLVFHYQRLWVTKNKDAVPDIEHLPGVNALFGFAADTKETESVGQVGAVFFSDVYPDTEGNGAKLKVSQMAHTSIDRFTGGVRDGVLYLEELLWKQPLKMTLWFDQSRLDAVDEYAREALKLTLEDLVDGRLALGAASSKGHGFFGTKESVLNWSDNGTWIEGKE